MIRTDVLVIGGGAAGLAAAIAASEAGARVVLVESNALGGILNQCIHNGFGLKVFKEELTGPEYAARYVDKIAVCPNVTVMHGMVTALSKELTAEVVSPQGCETVVARAAVLATGCRERAFGALNIASAHPAGIFTAGSAQKLVNIEGHAVGKKIVILGSGDIGLIMARRFTLEGAKVEAVLEIKPTPGGLNRNIAQCLTDFGIPLELSTTVVEVRGAQRVEEVVTAKVDGDLRPIAGTERAIKCDTLVLSVGLLPVVSLVPYVKMDSATGGALADAHGMTTVDGLFACGNALHVHDLVDNASEESARVGAYAAAYALRRIGRAETFALKCGTNVASVVPQRLAVGEDATLYVRLKTPLAEGAIVAEDANGHKVVRKRGAMAPNETVVVTLRAGELGSDAEIRAEEVV